MTDRNTIFQIVESLFEDWIDKNINVRPLAVENMRMLEADALALLKEQEEVEPYSHLTDDSDLYFTCGKCGHVIWSESYKYCPICGLKIAWNGEGR